MSCPAAAMREKRKQVESSRLDENLGRERREREGERGREREGERERPI